MLISGSARACVPENTITLWPSFGRFSEIGSDSPEEKGSAERLLQKRRRSLRDIVSYAEAILKRIDGETPEAFMADADLHDAVYYRLQCISEATRNLLLIDPDIIERHAEIPWVRVRAIGNVIRHEYGEIESSAVWATISGNSLRNLVTVANVELASLES